MRKVYQALAAAFVARNNCILSGNKEWQDKHEETIALIVRKHLPSGSGIDSGCEFDYTNSKPDKLVIATAFHHMSNDGYYTRWTAHDIIVRPSFDGISVDISGRDHNQIKEYLSEIFHLALTADFDRD